MELAMNPTLIVRNVCISVVFSAILGLFGLGWSAIFAVLIVMAAYILLLCCQWTPILINFHNQTGLAITFARFVLSRKILSIPYNSVVVNCGREVVGEGLKSFVLTVRDVRGKVILKLVPEYNGWSEEQIRQIYDLLKDKQGEVVPNN